VGSESSGNTPTIFTAGSIFASVSQTIPSGAHHGRQERERRARSRTSSVSIPHSTRHRASPAPPWRIVPPGLRVHRPSIDDYAKVAVNTVAASNGIRNLRFVAGAVAKRLRLRVGSGLTINHIGGPGRTNKDQTNKQLAPKMGPLGQLEHF
jgi:hypothetical protein